jgi:hypothetical protein
MLARYVFHLSSLVGHFTGNGFEFGRFGLPSLTNHRFTPNIPTNRNMHLCHACVMWHEYIDESFLTSITVVWISYVRVFREVGTPRPNGIKVHSSLQGQHHVYSCIPDLYMCRVLH